ncbi:MAG: tRNA uridine-5-carboxymethylaminomethyl(34) synthesis GTPase MnmE [SAR324 cluster bacterium]|nr:tRNA uridine-5-carboxymethylaminomethyl(34) synthesis GTPase MnmE [SAR324 cluster bacterium]
MKWKSEDTIAAIATPVGMGGVGIVRLSGSGAVAIVDPVFFPDGGGSLAEAESHRLLHGWIYKDEAPLDEVLVVAMRAPRSYTTEDVVEIHCHGAPLVLSSVLDLVVAGGARLAEPGEFTMRAFFNGRIDLTQAEAVGDIVRARSEAGLRVSVNQLRGKLYEAITGLKGDLQRVAALLAAGIDFPEEDIVFAHREEIANWLGGVQARLSELVAEADRGRIMRDGLGVAIVGRPNVGKSSLLNALLGEARAIVTEIPGTTRDTVEEGAVVGGVLLRLTDTAGIRHSDERVEQEGITRSRHAQQEADLVLLVLDGSEPLSGDDETLLTTAGPERTLVVVNKRDLMPAALPGWAERLAGFSHVVLSALTREGMDGLEQSIRSWAFDEQRPIAEHGMITNLRQKHAAQNALDAVQAATAALDIGTGDELLAIDLQRALAALGDIVGETTADDLLERIFAEFCIGK